MLAVCGVVSLVLAATGLVLWERAPYNTESAPFDNDVWYGYNPPGIQGIMLFLTFATLSVVLLSEAVDAHLHRVWSTGTRREKKCALAVCGACGAAYLGTAIFGLATWGSPVLACGVLFCVDPTVYNNWPSIRGDSFNVCIALAAGIAFLCLGAVLVHRTVKWLIQLSSLAGPANCSVDQVQHFAFSWRRPLLKLVVMLVMLVVLFFLSGYLPNDARRWTPAFMAGYASLEASKETLGTNYVYPELPNALMQSGNIHVGRGWVIKLYPSNMIFYASLALLLVVLFGLRLSPRLNYLRDKRIRHVPQFTIGDLGLLSVCLVVFALFFVYWLHDHNFKGLWSPATPTVEQMHLVERCARAMGQLAVILFAFLMLPAPRYSILYDVSGLSRESLLWLHRWFGYGMLAVTAGHAAAYLVHFYQVGTLSRNLFHIPTIIGAVRNDFTVILVTWATVIMFIAMGVSALNVVRRSHYELFYYTHLASSYLLIPAILWHAHSAWMYVLPAVSLWFGDQMVRLWQRAGHATVLSARTIGNDVVELICQLSGNQLLSVVYPGQYIYVNIPEIAVLQWHPFTLASNVPSEKRSNPLVMLIKSMGEETWTGKLYTMTLKKQPFTVRLEGPCGIPLDFAGYDRICLVGGGIGIVPCASIYGSLRNLLMDDKACSETKKAVRRVQVLWATRSAALAGAMVNYMDLPKSWHALAGGYPPSGLAPSCHCGNASHLLCDIFVTKKDEFDCFRRCESIPSERVAAKESLAALADRTSSSAVRCLAVEEDDDGHECKDGCLSFEKHVTVHCHRPDLERFIASFFSNSSFNASTTHGAKTASNDNKMRCLLFVCGPETLVKEVGRIGCELGIRVHQEEFLF